MVNIVNFRLQYSSKVVRFGEKSPVLDNSEMSE